VVYRQGVNLMEEPKSLTEMGESVYQRNKGWLEKEHMGKIVAISKDGVAGVGKEILEVYEIAKKKSAGPFYFRKVGPDPSTGTCLVAASVHSPEETEETEGTMCEVSNLNKS